MKKICLNPGWPHAMNAPFAAGIQLGGTIYVSGTLAQDPEGKVVGVGDMTVQARQVFRNIEAVLSQGGATLDDIVSITAYIADRSRFSDYAAVRAELFPDAQLASATVTCSQLGKPEFLIEIQATAVVGAGA